MPHPTASPPRAAFGTLTIQAAKAPLHDGPRAGSAQRNPMLSPEPTRRLAKPTLVSENLKPMSGYMIEK